MKRIITWMMLLVLFTGTGVSAFADYPTAAFSPSSRNQVVYYGETLIWKLKLNSGSYKKIRERNEIIYRANFSLTIEKEQEKVKILDYCFSGRHTRAFETETGRYGIFRRFRRGSGYRAVLRTYYRTGYGGSYTWKRCYKTSTSLRVY